MTEKTDSKLIKDLITQLFTLAGLNASATVEKGDGAWNVSLESDDTAILIGKRGQNLASLNRWLSSAVYAKIGEKFPIKVDVDNWRGHHEERLVAMALKLAQKAKFSGQPQKVTNLTPIERRVIHTALTDNSDVETFSEGVEPNRYLVINPK